MTTLKIQAQRDLISRQNTTQKDYSLGIISQIRSLEQFSVKTLTVSRVNPFVFVGVYSKTEICGLEHLYQSSLLRISLSFTMAKVNAKLKWWNSWVGRVYCHFDFGILSTVQCGRILLLINCVNVIPFFSCFVSSGVWEWRLQIVACDVKDLHQNTVFFPVKKIHAEKQIHFRSRWSHFCGFCERALSNNSYTKILFSSNIAFRSKAFCFCIMERTSARYVMLF